MVLKFPLMSTYSFLFYNGKRLFLTHGHLFNEDNLPPLAPGDVFLYGHTHVPKAEKKGNIIVINPGSISLPKENAPHIYGILNDNQFKIIDFDGNIFNEITI